MPTAFKSRRAPSARDLAWLQSRLDPIRQILAAKDYTVKGSLSFVNVIGQDGKVKTMNFRRIGDKHEISGPFIAKANAIDQFLIVSPWRGIPTIIDSANREQCKACLGRCFLCAGSGKINCKAEFCGGAGIRHEPATHYQDDQSGIAKCHGCKTCPVCNGTKQVDCNMCMGTGKRSTGKKDQSIEEYRASNLCPQCQGRCFAMKEITVTAMEFACGSLGTFLELGPVVAFSVQPTSDAPNRRSVLVYDCKENLEGEPLTILLGDAVRTPCEAFMIGGFYQERM